MNALALVAKHPEEVRTLVAHEPPLAAILPDRERRAALPRRSTTPTSAAASAPAWRSSSSLVSHKGRSPRTSPPSRRPTRPCSGCRPSDDGTRTDPLLGQNIITCTHYEPDFDALRAASTRIVLGAGVESDGEMAHRGAEAVAERLGTTPVTFPSGHGGFLGGEYGQTGEPDAFAAKLREVLAQG